jgi:ATP-dependent Lon protease
MSNNNIFLRAQEEDVDFLPIIPLNETDSEEEAIDTEKDIPILPLRNTVLFPGVVLPITVGRDKSIQAVNEAYKSDKLVGVIAQKDSNLEDPTVSDLQLVGTVAKVVKLIKMPDGGTTVIIQGKKRFKITAITSEDPFFKAKVAILNDEAITDTQNFQALAGSIKESSQRSSHHSEEYRESRFSDTFRKQ